MNNYDQSSTGVNIELSICYDTDLARIYFNDYFKSFISFWLIIYQMSLNIIKNLLTPRY